MRNDKVFKASFWYIASSLILKGIGFFSTPYFARTLSQDEYGIADNFFAVFSILSVITSLCLSSTLIRARFDYKEKLKQYIKNCLICGIFFCISLFLVFFIIKDTLLTIFKFDNNSFIVLFLVLLVNPSVDFYILLSQYEYKYIKVCIINCIIAISSVVLSVVLIFLLKDKALARIIGSQTPMILFGLVLSIYFLFNKQKIDFSFIKYALPISVPFIFHLLSGSLLTSSDRIMISGILGADKNANYSIACSVGQLASILATSLNTAFAPWLGERLNEKAFVDIKRFSYIYISFFFLLTMGIVLLAPEILFIISGNKYMSALNCIPPIIIGYIFLFFYTLYVNIEQFEKKTKGMAIATFLSAIINIILNFILIPRFGYIAAGYTTMISFFLMFIFHFILVRRMGLHICYNNKFIGLLCLVSFICALLANLLYQFYIIRYFVLFIYIIALILYLILNYNKFKSIIKE